MRPLTQAQADHMPVSIARRCNRLASNGRDAKALSADLVALDAWLAKSKIRLTAMGAGRAKMLQAQVNLVERYVAAGQTQARALRCALDTALGIQAWAPVMAEAREEIASSAQGLRESHSLNGRLVDNVGGLTEELARLDHLAKRLQTNG